jgi:hypothetical protein
MVQWWVQVDSGPKLQSSLGWLIWPGDSWLNQSINYTWVPIREQLAPCSTRQPRLALEAHVALIRPYQTALSWALSQNVWPSLVAWKCPPPLVDVEATSSMYPFWIDVGGLPRPLLPSGSLP